MPENGGEKTWELPPGRSRSAVFPTLHPEREDVHDELTASSNVAGA